MPAIVVFDKDEKAFHEIRNTLQLMKDDTIQVYNFKSEVDFLKCFEGDEENEPFIPIHYLIVNPDLLSLDLEKWILGFRASQKKLNRVPEESPTKIMLMGHIEKKRDISLLDVVDYIVKPIEKQLLLQKMEIHFNEGQDIKPSYLVYQKVDEEVELGRLLSFEQISEFSIGLKSTKMLKPGRIVNFHSKIFGGGEKLSHLMGKKTFSIPVDNGQYVNHFSLFGPNKDEIMNLRKYIQVNNLEKSHYRVSSSRKLPDSAVSDPNSKPNDLKVPEPTKSILSKKYNIAIVDNNDDNIFAIESAMKDFLKNAVVHKYRSYARLLVAIKPKEENKKTLLQWSTEPAFSFGSVFAGHLDAQTLDLINYETRIGLRDTILGSPIQDFRNNKQLFRERLFTDTKEDIEEQLLALEPNEAAVLKSGFFNHEGLVHILDMKLRRENNRIHFEANDITFTKDPAPLKPAGSVKSLDLVYMNEKLIPHNTEEWLANFEEAMRSNGVNEMKKEILVVLTKEHSRFVNRFRKKGVLDIIRMPYDRAHFMKSLIVMQLPELDRLKDDRLKKADLEIYNRKEPVFMSTLVKIKAMSEFGVKLEYPSKMQVGKKLYIFLADSLNMPDLEPILARCYYVEEKTKDKVPEVHFHFTGVEEVFYKRIRKWIIETYIDIKSKEESS